MKYSWLVLILLVTVVQAIPPQAPEVIPDQAPNVIEENVTTQAPIITHPNWFSPEEMPKGMEYFEATKKTQAIYILFENNIDYHIAKPVTTSSLDPKWRMSGGMLGIKGWRSDKFKLIPKDKGEDVEHWVGNIQVSNRFGGIEKHLGIKRKYPIGTRFDDILSSKDKSGNWVVFEHRSRSKQLIEGKEKWVSDVIYEDKEARPIGYNGLSVSCGSCHTQAGTGLYGEGLVPGGDGVISDPLDWSVWPEEK